MKIIRYILIALAVAVAAGMSGACSRTKTIPDGELKEIFKEIFISNAYVQSGNAALRPDTLDMYRPILERYGYTVEDMKYSIESFSRRKSMRVTDVISEAITELEAEEDHLRYLVAATDSVDVISQRMLRRLVREDSLIAVTRTADTARLTIDIPVEPGTYQISYSYYIDSLDANRSHRTIMRMFDGAGKAGKASATNWMNPRVRRSYSTKLDAMPGDSVLKIVFGNYPKKDLKEIDIRIDSLKVYYSPPVEIARDSALRITLGANSIYNEINAERAKDSGTQGLHAPWIAAPGDSIR